MIWTGYAKNSLQIQLTFKGWSWKPFYNELFEFQEDLKVSSVFTGWLFIQCRWFRIN